MSTRRPRFTSRMTTVRNRVLEFVMRPLAWLSPATRFALGFALIVLITTLLLVNSYTRVPAEFYREGDVVRRTVIAPEDIAGVDIKDWSAEKERLRVAAINNAPPVFNFDPTRSENAAQTFRAAWEDLRNQADARATSKKEPQWNGEGVTEKARPEIARALLSHRIENNDLERLMGLLRETGDRYIYDDQDAERLAGKITLVDVRNPAAPAVLNLPPERLVSLATAHGDLSSRISQLSGWSHEQQAALVTAMLPLVKPHLSFDQRATQLAQETAAKNVKPPPISLRRNQVVAREGDTVTEPMLAQFREIREYERTGRPWHHLIGLFFIVTAIYWGAWKFAEHRSTVANLMLSDRKAFALIGMSVIVQTIIMRVCFTFTESIASGSMRAPYNDATIWNYAIPFAAAALLVALLVDTQIALITALITALFAGLLAPDGVLKAFYAMISSLVAIYGIGRYRERQSVTQAGLIVGGVNALLAVAIIAYGQQALTLNTILLAVACGFVGGLLAAVFTGGGLPINESIFGILTDVKLLELSNADLPVLGQLALRAPGTNQHSHAVGQLAEEACRAIGANPLLARIGALYHDIGKTAAPDMFVENQQGENPHDRLRPSQSARIITSHVTYGLKLAKEIGLPRQITDFIPQHHGTRTLHFFLRKAQAQAAPNEEINEAEFRYPGPKPQFKEAAIMMIADSCEAAARSLAHPDPENIRTIVTKIVDAIISDGQLDESNLTLHELRTIREAIITSLTAIYHARIDYPGFNPPALTGALPPLPEAQLDTEERGVSYNRTSEIPINKGGEVEDEALPRKTVKR
ncbi:MAG TPA: HDIG domain-containing protein [Pyrinomonadaceae bacterium]|nr:HDIG domain-containing protein [Pyrinomonadaceae bacterium]